MKTILNITLSACILVLIASCSSGHRDQSNVSTAEIESLQDSLEVEMSKTLQNIESDLLVVLESQDVFLLPNQDEENLPKSQKEKILQSIGMINSIMAESKYRIDSLHIALEKGKRNQGALWSRVEKSKAQIEELELAIDLLKTSLVSRDFKIEELNRSIKATAIQLDSFRIASNNLDSSLHRAYMAIGTGKDLRAFGITTVKGGLLGIGRTKSLDPELNNDLFVEVDTRELRSVPIQADKIKLISKHPESSYAITENENETALLQIEDPEAFWRINKHLVIQVAY